MKRSRPSNGKEPRNYLSRREQWRLLLLVVGLGLVVFMMSEARDPDHWRWVWNWPQAGAGGGESGPEIDTRLQPDLQAREIPGSFVSPPQPDNTAAEEAPQRGYFPGVKQTYLDTIQDNTILRASEKDAWFHLLALLEKSDSDVLRKASTGRVTFVQLYEQSDEYRGELVTLRGTLRRAHRLTAPKNQYGIEAYYQTWLQPIDNRVNPIVVYVLELPTDFPIGMDLSEEVELTGFYFKRWAYSAQDTVRLAPVVLSKTVEWFPSVSLADRTRNKQLPFWTVLAAALALAVLVTASIVIRTRHKPVAAETAGAWSQIADLDTLSSPGQPIEEPGPERAEAMSEHDQEGDNARSADGS